MAKLDLSGRGTWAQRILLFVMGAANAALATALLLSERGRLSFDFDPLLVAHYLAFAQASAVVMVGLLALPYWLSSRYDPQGRQRATTHRWVYVRSGKKARDATVREVYERQHGRGSWKKKVKRERTLLGVVGCLVALALVAYGLETLLSQKRVAVVTGMASLFDSGTLLAVTWIGLGLVGLASLPAATLAFWDQDLGLRPTARGGVTPTYRLPPMSTLVLRGVLLAGVVLLHAAILAGSLVPGIRSAMAGAFPWLLVALFYTSAAFWLFGALLPDPGYSEEHKAQRDREAAGRTRQQAVEILFSQDAGRKERYVAAFFLLSDVDALTAQGRREVVKALKVLSGKDFGDDYGAWKDWLLRQV